ncbi:PREDICTED: uncharacterized protein LOC105360214 isoform X1 [Ceratosolen solmsi marchali]|uniref:Ubiquitin-related modifier 1 n=1 Tax=Ceratosolen solmsi marchali TaxID=326594 RepID=A0AAJ6YCN8_9HYME|nr:PREDICTED: uncharacterized protein LOC105360214 isoform X1 [Ceratosolen solmsi marchali]
MTECSDKLPLTIEFGGGVELLLYDKIKKHNISLPGDRIWTLGDLVLWLKNNMIKERCELFIQNDTVARPSTCCSPTTRCCLSQLCTAANASQVPGKKAVVLTAAKATVDMRMYKVSLSRISKAG